MFLPLHELIMILQKNNIVVSSYYLHLQPEYFYNNQFYVHPN